MYKQWSHPRSGSALLAGWQCSCITDRPVRLPPEALASEQALTHSHSRTALSLAAAAEGLGGTEPGTPRRSTSCVQLHCVCARTHSAGTRWCRVGCEPREMGSAACVVHAPLICSVCVLRSGLAFHATMRSCSLTLSRC